MTAARRRVHVIGIGTGSPEHLTMQAVTALNEVDVFLVPDKGSATEELVAIRRLICERYVPGRTFRFLTVSDPPRGEDASRGSAAYRRGVRDWHDERARRYAAVLDELPGDAVVGFLVWGDPAFYDSTIRIVDALARLVPIDKHVVPGISAIQVLAAEHGIVLHEIGQPVHVTTGRRLLQEWSPQLGTVVVMLDAGLACRGLVDRAGDLTIAWGAYLGMPQQVLRSGRLADVVGELVALRTELRAQHGWIMDCYALLPSTS